VSYALNDPETIFTTYCRSIRRAFADLLISKLLPPSPDIPLFNAAIDPSMTANVFVELTFATINIVSVEREADAADINDWFPLNTIEFAEYEG
jgi:hypothetical protein